jgi:hypothetical protein
MPRPATPVPVRLTPATPNLKPQPSSNFTDNFTWTLIVLHYQVMSDPVSPHPTVQDLKLGKLDYHGLYSRVT